MSHNRELLLLAVDLYHKAYCQALDYATVTKPERRINHFHAAEAYKNAALMTLRKEHHNHTEPDSQPQEPPQHVILTQYGPTGKDWIHQDNGWNCIKEGSAGHECCPHEWRDIYQPKTHGGYTLHFQETTSNESRFMKPT
jgi:hypothetical protein